MRRIVALAAAGAAFAAVLGFAGYSVARDTIALPAVALEGGRPLSPAATRRATRTTTHTTTARAAPTRSTRTRSTRTPADDPTTPAVPDTATAVDDDPDEGDSSGRGRGRNRGRGGGGDDD